MFYDFNCSKTYGMIERVVLMENFHVSSEEVLGKIKVSKDISKKDIRNNFIANLLVIGGDIPNDIFFTLTKDTLYIEYKGHVALGYAEETREIEEIPLSDVKSFEVICKDSEERITLTTAHATRNFIRDNWNHDNLAFLFSEKLKALF